MNDKMTVKEFIGALAKKLDVSVEGLLSIAYAVCYLDRCCGGNEDISRVRTKFFIGPDIKQAIEYSLYFISIGNSSDISSLPEPWSRNEEIQNLFIP